MTTTPTETPTPTPTPTPKINAEDFNESDVTFELKWSNPLSPANPVYHVNSRPREELAPWLVDSVATAKLPFDFELETVPTVKFVVLNLKKDQWSADWPYTGDLGASLQALSISPQAYIADDSVRWSFFAPDWDIDGPPPAKKDLVIGRALCSYRSGIAWKFYPKKFTTLGVLWYDDDDGQEHITDLLEDIIKHHRLIVNPLMHALLFVKVLVEYKRPRIENQKKDVRKSQVDSGFHAYHNEESGKVAENIDFGSLSASVSGSMANLASNELSFTRMRNCLLETIIHNDALEYENSDILVDIEAARAHIGQQTVYYSQECANWIQEAASWQAKAAMVIQGLFNLIAQKDNKMNIAIARDSKILAEQSQRIAYESRVLTEETKKDTTSMEAIAAVTMFFLPATFVASFLDMPIFTLDAEHNTIQTRQMWIFWVITIPLTVVSVVCWLLWCWISARHTATVRRKQGMGPLGPRPVSPAASEEVQDEEVVYEKSRPPSVHSVDEKSIAYDDPKSVRSVDVKSVRSTDTKND